MHKTTLVHAQKYRGTMYTCTKIYEYNTFMHKNTGVQHIHVQKYRGTIHNTHKNTGCDAYMHKNTGVQTIHAQKYRITIRTIMHKKYRGTTRTRTMI